MTRRDRPSGRPRVGSPQWHREFEADRARMERFHRLWFPICVAASIVGAAVAVVMILLGKLPLWILFV